MLLWLADYLSEFYSPFSVVKYLTLRGIFSVITALVICWVLGPRVIRLLNSLQMGQAIRSDGPQSHLSKAGTPTMGGALILLAIFISTLLWANLENLQLWSDWLGRRLPQSGSEKSAWSARKVEIFLAVSLWSGGGALSILYSIIN